MIDHHPTVAEVTAALTEQGVAVPATLVTIVAAVIADMEVGTGFRPFLGEATEQTWRFDPPDLSGYLDFKGGFWAVTSITAGVVYGSTGTALTSGLHYELVPYNAALELRGWTGAQFRGLWGDVPRSVAILGKRGYAEKLPDDVYQAEFDEMQRRAALKSQAGGEQASEVKQGLFTIKLATGGESSLVDVEDRFNSTILKYRRI